MAQIHNDTGKDLRENKEDMAIYRLLKKVGNDTDKAHDILRDINYYPSPDVVGKVSRQINAEQKAMETLNRVAANWF